MAAEAVVEVDPFEEAFAKFAAPPADETTPPVVSLLDPPPVTEEKKAEDAAAKVGEIEGLTDEEKANAASEAAKVAKDAAPATGNANDEDLLKRFAKIVQEAQPPVKQPETPQTVEPPPQPILTRDDAQFLQTFEKDYPEMARAMLVVQRAATTQMLTHVMGELNRALAARDEILQELGVRQQESDLVAAVPDYNDIHGKVTAWVKTQPRYLQPAYEHVIANGTADEVIDLIGQWRASTGAVVPTATASVSTRSDSELSTAAKKAVAALAPVTSKRTATPVSASDPDDFDGAFARFAAASART
jgi:hypothetical protein